MFPGLEWLHFRSPTVQRHVAVGDRNKAMITWVKFKIFNFVKYFILGGSQPQWPNRFPAPGPPGSPSGPSRIPGASGQWSSDRTSYYGPSGGPGPGQGHRPPFRGDVRGPAPGGLQRPVG